MPDPDPARCGATHQLHDPAITGRAIIFECDRTPGHLGSHREITGDFAGTWNNTDAPLPPASDEPRESAVMHMPRCYVWTGGGCTCEILRRWRTSDEERERLRSMTAPMRAVLAEIALERGRQDAKWGEQNHPDGTGPQYADRAEYERTRTTNAAEDGTLTFRHVLLEEVYEALTEDDPAKLRAELVQVVAVGVAWIEAIDRRATQAALEVGAGVPTEPGRPLAEEPDRVVTCGDDGGCRVALEEVDPYERTAPVAEGGCDDCSVEPGETHRHPGCPGIARQRGGEG